MLDAAGPIDQAAARAPADLSARSVHVLADRAGARHRESNLQRQRPLLTALREISPVASFNRRSRTPIDFGALLLIFHAEDSLLFISGATRAPPAQLSAWSRVQCRHEK